MLSIHGQEPVRASLVRAWRRADCEACREEATAASVPWAGTPTTPAQLPPGPRPRAYTLTMSMTNQKC